MVITINEVTLKKLGRHLLKGVSFGLPLYGIAYIASKLAMVDIVNQLTDCGVIKVPDTSVDQIGFDINSPAYEEEEEEDEEDCQKTETCNCKAKRTIGF